MCTQRDVTRRDGTGRDGTGRDKTRRDERASEPRDCTEGLRIDFEVKKISLTHFHFYFAHSTPTSPRSPGSSYSSSQSLYIFCGTTVLDFNLIHFWSSLCARARSHRATVPGQLFTRRRQRRRRTSFPKSREEFFRDNKIRARSFVIIIFIIMRSISNFF